MPQILTVAVETDSSIVTRVSTQRRAPFLPLVISGASLLADSVTYDKLANLAASKVLGRGSAAGTGDPEPITLGTNLSMAGTTLNASGGGGSDILAWLGW